MTVDEIIQAVDEVILQNPTPGLADMRTHVLEFWARFAYESTDIFTGEMRSGVNKAILRKVVEEFDLRPQAQELSRVFLSVPGRDSMRLIKKAMTEIRDNPDQY